MEPARNQSEPGTPKGRRVFQNYPSAYAASESVSAAVYARVAAAKTLHLGPWAEVEAALNELFKDYFVFPMGAVPKPHDPTVARPTSDHTRTGFNALVLLWLLRQAVA